MSTKTKRGPAGSRIYVESDGDHYPKDVYICDDGGRVATMVGHNEIEMKRLAKEIVHARNCHDDLVASLQKCVAAMGDVVRDGAASSEEVTAYEEAKELLKTIEKETI